MHLIDHCWKYQNGTGVFRTEDGQEFHDFFSYAELAGMKINAPERSRIQNCSGLIQKTTPLNLRRDIRKNERGITVVWIKI